MSLHSCSDTVLYLYTMDLRSSIFYYFSVLDVERSQTRGGDRSFLKDSFLRWYFLTKSRKRKTLLINLSSYFI